MLKREREDDHGGSRKTKEGVKMYQLKWANGQFSAFTFPKDEAIKGINHWIQNKRGWGYIEVINTKTNKKDVIFEDDSRVPISNIFC
jgi:hypothetical protein